MQTPNEKKTSYIRHFADDWRSGCTHLSLEQEGLLSRVCNYIWAAGKAVPLDPIAAARVLYEHPKTYRRVLAELMAMGKLIEAEGGIINRRAWAELAWSRDRSTRQSTNAKAKRSGQHRPNIGATSAQHRFSNSDENGDRFENEQQNQAVQPNLAEAEPMPLRTITRAIKKEEGEDSPRTAREAGASPSSSGGLFSLDEQGAGLIRNGSMFKWLDPQTGEKRHLTFQFVEGMAPNESKQIVRDFAENELRAHIESGKSGGLHGLIRHAIDKGRLGAFKRRRLAPAGIDNEPPDPPPLAQGSWD